MHHALYQLFRLVVVVE